MRDLRIQIPVQKPIKISAENFEKYIPGFQLLDHEILSAQDYIKKCDERVKALVSHDYSATDIHRVRSLMMDRLICGLFSKHEATALSEQVQKGQSKEYVLIATGGYAREEMSLFSDIDLLLLHRSKSSKTYKPLMEKLLYVLWDLKLDVGHAVRKLNECEDLMKAEQTIFTSMLDLRPLTGSPDLFQELVDLRNSLIRNKKNKRKFFQAKLDERASRLEKYGRSVYLLQPNIKEGEGALRDLHFIRWLAGLVGIKTGFQGLYQNDFIDKAELQFLEYALEYFLDLRNRLHLLSKKRNDQMTFDMQEGLSKRMRYYDEDEGILGVERFMQNYYAVATRVNKIVNTLIKKIVSFEQGFFSNLIKRLQSKKIDGNFKVVNRQIMASNHKIFSEHPSLLMLVFRYAQQFGFDIHFETKDLIENHLNLVDENFRKQSEVNFLFRQIISDFHNLGHTLFVMHQVQFIDRFIPEFGKIRNRIQHDAYHAFTVDTHSILAINEISNLFCEKKYQEKFPSYREALLSIQRPDLLTLGLLFHDIGKGGGGDHCVLGGKLATDITSRFGYSKAEQEIIEFLVLSHLMMSHLSQRRDINDHQLISEFAHSIGSLDRLNMLYVLTWADIRAVGTDTWTDWRGGLLTSLYEKTLNILTSREDSQDVVRRRVADVRKAILHRMKSQIDENQLEKFLESISPRYVLAHTDAEIYDHFHFIMGHDDSKLSFMEKEIPDSSVSDLFIYTMNNPRIVPLATGVMLALEINILAMEFFMLSDGHVFIKMRVQTKYKESLRKEHLVPTLERYLNDVFTGKNKVEDLIQRRQRAEFMVRRPIQRARTQILVDNDVSAYYTVIDVFAHDRLGLLYDIVKCLVTNGCYVEVSKISTKVEQVVDSFYVKDIFGHKITSKQKLTEIKQSLLNVIEGTGK